MKIRSITLDGFWGYREGVRVDIAGLPMLVAVGHNGSGKSALVVNGIIAGLYGKFPTRIVEESITVGANSGTVVVEFEVNDSIYRVARTHPRSGAATASVHRLVDGDWDALTEKGVREATAKVTEILGMNYETAVMTWIAEQGNYDVFAKADPAPRFKMLANVFDLAKYVPLHTAAKNELAKAKEAVAVAEGRVSELNDDLVEDDARAETQMTDDALAVAAATAHAAFDDASTALAAHQQNDPQIAVGHARAALAAVKDLRLERLRAAEQTLTDLRVQREAAPQSRDAAIATAHARFERESNSTRSAIDGARADAERRVSEAQSELASVADIIAGQGAREAAVDDALAAIERARDTARARELAFEQRNADLRDAESALHAAQVAVGEAQDALAALAHAGECYACGQHITEQVAKTLRVTQEQVLANREEAVADAREAAAAARAVFDEGHTTDRLAEAVENELRDSLAAARDAVADAERAIGGAERIRTSLTRDEARIEELRAEASAASARIAAERDQAIAAAHAEFDARSADITARGKTAAADVNTLRRPTEEEDRLERDFTAAENIAAGDSRYAAEAARLTAERDTARHQATAHDAEIGRRAEIARRQAEYEARITAAKAALAKAQTDVTVHSELVSAYAPGGIPSMILETVIGDLNDAINVTLTELSGGELEVRLTTARENASGTAESKVTVYVDTPTGARAYEALSGGQRFRVDLAIRTGLAAIVARGTGTPIETFILDEGWGSLDEAGIRSTLGVLGKLSEQTNVLTVSHVDSVREAFPARIEVSTNEGTSAALVVR